MDKKPESSPKSKLTPRQKWVVRVVLGVGLAYACNFAPPVYQVPCRAVAKLVGFVMGVG